MGDLLKAKQSDTVVVTRQDFRRFPDNWKTNLQFQSFQRLSQVNRQQNDFRWGSAELVRWKSTSGRDLQGLLYKPDNFDPGARYPMIVYYYERNSDTLHRYYPPAAGRSTINISFYVSRGYVVFVPDIVYETAAPGRSAMDCVIPGVDHLIAQGFVDPARMGLQGHSWGGYQTAYLVSQTDRFAAAEAGAPVSNMTSAYGGIRWESGLSRMFQYERTQSRFGSTLWEAREAYIENSPLFYADRIRTPLLILHNDNDGAVPWYQGIELFMALRRLERPAWLVNYNGEPHGISKEENRRDFAVRMQQFFDHYLQGAPPAKWMVTGIPATEKGRDLGLELVPEPAAASAEGEKPDQPAPRRPKRQRGANRQQP
jgi:dipeptidyl aminopeptidase/acylaminoacyl peptidase